MKALRRETVAGLNPASRHLTRFVGKNSKVTENTK
jgi:hypothetical protein